MACRLQCLATIGLISLLIVVACEGRKRSGDSGSDPHSGDVPRALKLLGSASADAGECVAISLQTVDLNGVLKTSPVVVSVLLSTGFHSDSQCLLAISQTTIPSLTSSLMIYFKSTVTGSQVLSATDKTSRLLPAQFPILISPNVNLIISNEPAYNFGSAYVGTTLEKALSLTNSGPNPASAIAPAIPYLASPFGFKGSSFPGVGGTCANLLPGNSTCSLVVSFSPTALQGYSQSLSIGFSDGVQTKSVSRALLGEGVSSGSLDSSFGASGKVVTPGGVQEDRAMALLAESDGKIVIAGSSLRSGTSYDAALVRYNADGTLDPQFGVSGKAFHALFSSEDRALAVARQGDGKYVIAGYAFSGSTYDFVVARINTDGSLDSSFGSSGKTVVAIGSSHDYAFALAIDSGGRLVVGGYSLNTTTNKNNMAFVRLNSDGTIDTSFGTSGKTTISVGSGSSYCYGLSIQSDGKLIAVGNASVADSDVAVVRLSTDGSLDSTYGSGGKKTIDINSSSDVGYAVQLQSDGKAVIAGTASFGGGSDFAAVRLNTDGSPDTGFDFDGKTYIPIGPSLDDARGVALQSNGRIVIGGMAYNGMNYDFALTRLFSDGAVDTAFGTSGKLVTPIGAGSDRIFGLAIDAFGRIVSAGDTLVDSTLDFAVLRYLP